MIRRPPRSTPSQSSAASDVYKRQVHKLMDVIQRLVDKGNSVIVIEHNLDVIRCSDWIIDLGPDGGDKGGEIIAEGIPEDVAKNPISHTAKYLKKVLN